MTTRRVIDTGNIYEDGNGDTNGEEKAMKEMGRTAK